MGKLTPLGDLFAAIDRMMLEEDRTEEEVVTHVRQYIEKLRVLSFSKITLTPKP